MCCLVGMVCSVTFVVFSLLCLGGRYHFVPGLVLFLIFGVCHTWSMTYMWVKTCIVALTTRVPSELLGVHGVGHIQLVSVLYGQAVVWGNR